MTGADNTYMEMLSRRKTYSNLLEWAKQSIKFDKDWTLCEFGIGKKGFASFYMEKVKKAYGVDLVDYSSYHPEVEFVVSDGKHIPLPDESIDIVVSHSVLEHVEDIYSSISEINRILKVGGLAFLSVAPLYFSAEGSHVDFPIKLDNWEHLDPGSDYYMLEETWGERGDFLNKLTTKMFLSAVGAVPWNICRLDYYHDHKKAPDIIHNSDIPKQDIYIREFRFIGRKMIRFASDGPASVPHNDYHCRDQETSALRAALAASEEIVRRQAAVLDRIGRHPAYRAYRLVRNALP